ncbi:MAG: hypothetical protein AAFV71_17300, partial [Cyanobacteria bacterium J06633_8]
NQWQGKPFRGRTRLLIKEKNYYFFINKRFKSLFFVGVVLKTVPIFLEVIKVNGLPCLRYTHLVTPSGEKSA